jgi:MarR family transcriptional regulator, lower aerobic nicotinate degradation pathway regulator
MTARPVGSPTPPGAHQALSPADGLAQLSFLIHAILERRAREHDLSITQVRLLGVLRDRTPTMNELAKLLDLDKSSITGLIDRAQRRGIVTRVPSTTDRRAVLVALTAHGRSLSTTGTAHFEADVAQLLSYLTPPDRQALSQLISKLLITHATGQGIDLFATTEDPQAGSAS